MDVMDRLAAANPMPDGASKPESIMSAAALRNVIDDRRGTMQTQDRNRINKTRPPARRRRGLLVAAAAFAVVVVAGLSIALLTNTGSEATPDVIDSPPSTVVTPSTRPVPRTDAMNEALSEVAAALSGTGALPSAAGGVVFDDDPLSEYVGFAAALGTVVTFNDCSIDGAAATCRGSRTNRILDAMGYEETGTWAFAFNDAWVYGDTGATPILISLDRELDPDSRLFYEGIGSSAPLEEDYLLWMNAVHPEWRIERGIGEFEETPFDPATGTIFNRYIDEYRQAITESGPPESPYQRRW